MSNSTKFPDALAVVNDDVKPMIPIITLDVEEVPGALEVADVKAMIPITLDIESSQYDSWAELFKVQARVRGVIDHILPPTDPTEKARVDKEKAENLALWKRIDAVVLQWIYATVSIDILTLIFVDDDSAAHAWESVANLFQGNESGTPALVATSGVNQSVSVPWAPAPALVANHLVGNQSVVPGANQSASALPPALVPNQSASVVPPALVTNQSASVFPGASPNVISNRRNLWSTNVFPGPSPNVDSNGRNLWSTNQGTNVDSNGGNLWSTNVFPAPTSPQMWGWKPWCRTTTSVRKRRQKSWYTKAKLAWRRKWRKFSRQWQPFQLIRRLAPRPSTTAMVLGPFRNALNCLSRGLDRGFDRLDRWFGNSPEYYWGPAPNNSSSPRLMQPIARTSVRGYRGNSQLTRTRRGTRTPRQPKLTWPPVLPQIKYDIKPPVLPQLTYHVKTERRS